MHTHIFSRFRDLIYEQSGISLTESKLSLLQSRIGKRMRAIGLNDEKEYLQHVIADKSGYETIFLLDAISTNVTSFFRESEHFERLALAATDWLASNGGKLRIWSAACSTGQEPYTIGMTLSEVARSSGLPSTDIKILATDISTRVLEIAQRGRYSQRDVQQIPYGLRQQYLSSSSTEGDAWNFSQPLVRLVTFRRLNLSKPPFPMKGPFDAIFCRNVMIYFDTAVRSRLVADMVRLLRPGGLLFIGHAESLMGINSGLMTVSPSVYQNGLP